MNLIVLNESKFENFESQLDRFFSRCTEYREKMLSERERKNADLIESLQFVKFPWQIDQFLSRLTEYQEQELTKRPVLTERERKNADLIESLQYIKFPWGVVFQISEGECGFSVLSALTQTLGVSPEQILIEVAVGIYYSGWLALEQWKNRPFQYLKEWKFRKAYFFKNKELVAKKKLPPGSDILNVSKEFPDADKILEVWCMEWEFYDKFVIDYWFEWGGQCLWGGNRKAKEKFGYAINVDKLPLSEPTKSLVTKMGKWHDTALDWSNPGHGESPWSREERLMFSRAELMLLDTLRKELGKEYEIFSSLEIRYKSRRHG